MPALRTLQLRNVRKEEERAGGALDSDPPVVPPFVLPELNLNYQAHQDPGHARLESNLRFRGEQL